MSDSDDISLMSGASESEEEVAEKIPDAEPAPHRRESSFSKDLLDQATLWAEVGGPVKPSSSGAPPAATQPSVPSSYLTFLELAPQLH